MEEWGFVECHLSSSSSVFSAFTQKQTGSFPLPDSEILTMPDLNAQRGNCRPVDWILTPNSTAIETGYTGNWEPRHCSQTPVSHLPAVPWVAFYHADLWGTFRICTIPVSCIIAVTQFLYLHTGNSITWHHNWNAGPRPHRASPGDTLALIIGPVPFLCPRDTEPGVLPSHCHYTVTLVVVLAFSLVMCQSRRMSVCLEVSKLSLDASIMTSL